MRLSKKDPSAALRAGLHDYSSSCCTSSESVRAEPVSF